jgi:gluconate 5-dehydrogenase
MNVKRLFSLENKVAVVTGGYSHLGLNMVEALAEAGAYVYIAGKDEKKCKKSASNFREHQFNGKVDWSVLDILSSKSIKNAFRRIVIDSGKIDILVNNASFMPTGSLEKVSEADWELGMQGTINGVFRCTKEVMPIMIKNKSGSIINIASMYGEVSPDPSIYGKSKFHSPPQYGAGKAAIIQFTRYTACHFAKKGIRANAISPGPFPKPEVQKNHEFINNLKKKTPMNRIGKPWELKGVVVFLASEASSFVTGENIHVDGGWTAW